MAKREEENKVTEMVKARHQAEVERKLAEEAEEAEKLQREATLVELLQLQLGARAKIEAQIV